MFIRDLVLYKENYFSHKDIHRKQEIITNGGQWSYAMTTSELYHSQSVKLLTKFGNFIEFLNYNDISLDKGCRKKQDDPLR